MIATAARLLALAATCGLLAGCASPGFGGSEIRFGFFQTPQRASDPWVAKIEDWQQRERRDRPDTALAPIETQRAKPRSMLLRVKMGRCSLMNGRGPPSASCSVDRCSMCTRPRRLRSSMRR